MIALVRVGRLVSFVIAAQTSMRPENTYASASRCIEWGMDVLEVDVNMSADGELVLFHGPDLERTTNGAGRINTTPDHQLRELDAGTWFATEFQDERIPRLDEFLDWVDHRIDLYFDVKRADLGRFAELIHTAGYAESCFAWFGNPEKARQFHELAPELPLKINVSQPQDVWQAKAEFGAGLVETSLQHATPELIAACRGTDTKPHDIAAAA